MLSSQWCSRGANVVVPLWWLPCGSASAACQTMLSSPRQPARPSRTTLRSATLPSFSSAKDPKDSQHTPAGKP
ncbi:hypothetical protein E2C01_058883 [Portunus trituberculatus]|uniref:Secreted protein n=1 Tax=Portunus trituberculatus TaxID=210409 RepID=A0A5B7H113_PORTR|nr:hypothetical protein [Portunus trituberculatus]